MKGVTKEYISDRVSSKTLSRYFDKYLAKPPLPRKSKESKDIYIKIDAQYYGDLCIVVVKTEETLIYWKHFDKETLWNYVRVFKDLVDFGYRVRGITSDWHRSLTGSVEYFFKGAIPHQRCLVHTQRRCRTLLTNKPKLKAAKQLSEVVSHINKIGSKYEANIWLLWLARWEERWIDFVNKRSYGTKDNGSKTWWYTHKNLRATYRTLVGSEGHLFFYLDYEDLDKDTNGLEGEFSHLKQKIGAHRGLKKTRKLSMIYWYIFLKNREKN